MVKGEAIAVTVDRIEQTIIDVNKVLWFIVYTHCVSILFNMNSLLEETIIVVWYDLAFMCDVCIQWYKSLICSYIHIFFACRLYWISMMPRYLLMSMRSHNKVYNPCVCLVHCVIYCYIVWEHWTESHGLTRVLANMW